MDMEKAVGDVLRACRQKKQISQEQLGFDAGIHRTYVSLIERGVKSPTLGVLFRLCQALDVPPAKFVRNVERRMEKKDKANAFAKMQQQLEEPWTNHLLLVLRHRQIPVCARSF